MDKLQTAEELGLPGNTQTDNPEQREQRFQIILKAVEHGFPTKQALKYAGVNPSSFYDWVNKDAELLSRYEQSKHYTHEQIGETAKLCALKALDDPKYITALIFYCKARLGWNDGTGYNVASTMPSINYEKAED